MTYLAVAIGPKSIDEAAERIKAAKKAGAEMLELRTDYLVDLDGREAILTNYEGRCFSYPQVKPERVSGENLPSETLFKILDNGGES